jgi:hypothetical protein
MQQKLYNWNTLNRIQFLWKENILQLLSPLLTNNREGLQESRVPTQQKRHRERFPMRSWSHWTSP